MNATFNPFTFNEFLKAARQCRKSVSWKESVTLWMDGAVENIYDLMVKLEDGTYELSNPTVFRITDPKPRTISATKFHDRVVQRLMCNNGVYHDLTYSLIYDNCACQKGKGTTFTIERVKTHLRNYYLEHKTNEGYWIHIDIRKYFPSIPHEILKQKVTNCVEYKKILILIYEIIDEFVKIRFDDDLGFLDKDFGVRGIGLGSQLCQLFALLYLSELDHFIKETLKVKHYIRYMDDMLIFVKTKEEAERIFEILKTEVEKLGLVFNDKSAIFSLKKSIQFLKIDFMLTETGKVKTKLSREALNREIVRIHKLCKDFKKNKIPFRKLLHHLNTWHGFAKERASKNQMRNIKRILDEQFKDFKKIIPEIVESEDEIIVE